MHKRLQTLLVLCFFFIVNGLVAQTYNFINYNVGEGLEQSDILCVSQASNGYLLFGSNGGGLGYYDGYNFNTLKEKNGVSNNVVFSIVKDGADNIWLATNSGVTEVSPNLTRVKRTMNLGVPYYCAHHDPIQDKLYFGSGKGLYYFDEKVDSLVQWETSNEVLNQAFINTIYTDSKNNMWVGTRQNGLFKITDKNIEVISVNEGLPSNFIKTVIESNNKIYVGSLDGLAFIENGVINNVGLPNLGDGKITITTSAKYHDELVFGALNKHLYFVNPEDNSFRYINETNSFNYLKVWSVFVDNENILWFGSLAQGLTKFNSTFTYYNKENGLQGSYVNMVFASNDELWLGYKGAGIDIIKENKIATTLSNKEIGSSIMNRIVKIGDKVYLGRNNGLTVYEDGVLNSIPFKQGKASDVYSIYKYKGVVYVGTKTGLHLLDEDSIRLIPNSPTDFIFDILAHDNSLYLASNNGYYVFKQGEFTFISAEENFSAGRVRCFAKDLNNNLWLGTDEGIFIKRKNNYLLIDESAGLASDNVYFLQLDENGHMWAGTNKGVDRIKVSSAIDANKELNIRNYAKQEGLIGVECNLNAVSLNKKGELWIGTINGAYLYHKEEDKINTIPPLISLNNIKLNFRDVDWKEYAKQVSENSGLPSALELNHTKNNFIFEYVGVSLKNPEKVSYQYQLKGFDQDWLPLTKDRKAVYTALVPGDYTFILKAKNNDDVWVKEPVEFSFTIFPPWYQTKLFYVSVVLLILVSIYLIMYFRTRNLKRTQQRLTQQVDERTKELREEKEKVELINIEIEEQKTVIEVANKNITDSINYAKKIQEAILPKSDKLEQYVSNIEVLYLPKDVVSGDFYWYDKLGGKLVLAAADCTGHGVPGAFMSMIGVNNLNQIILENKVTNPSHILGELNVAIKKVLRQEDKGSESRDGMDISICTIDVADKSLQYAGAFRPLIYVRDGELHEIKGSRNPIGGNSPKDFVYNLNEFEFQKGDVFYMFSDGYPDQFGGAKGKKFMNKRLKQIFLDHHQKSPQEQRGILEQEFYKWMGDEEQVDDILVMIMQF